DGGEVTEPGEGIDKRRTHDGSESLNDALPPTGSHRMAWGTDPMKSANPGQSCLHELFEVQVERTPDAVAVVAGDEHVTYRALNARTNQLAHHLRELGVGSEVHVGLCVERSAELVVGILGILKAGGAYVPLDPAYPSHRLEYMLKASRVPAVVTQSRWAERLSGADARLVSLDAEADRLAEHASENPAKNTLAGNLAYVMFTSGSTGEPRGVTITHGNVVRLFDASRHWFRFDQRDVWTLFHSCSFDFSVWEMWG
ncbi:unnamed protein product, partial [marine sediment metagenome]